VVAPFFCFPFRRLAPFVCKYRVTRVDNWRMFVKFVVDYDNSRKGFDDE
jgi:hypothetical protein